MIAALEPADSALAAGNCRLPQIAITRIPQHQLRSRAYTGVESSRIPTTFFRTWEAVASRRFVLLYLSDRASVENAADFDEDQIALTKNGHPEAMTFPVPSLPTALSVVFPTRRLVERDIATTVGRVGIAFTTWIPQPLDDPAIEEGFIGSLVARQVAAIPKDCLVDDISLLTAPLPILSILANVVAIALAFPLLMSSIILLIGVLRDGPTRAKWRRRLMRRSNRPMTTFSGAFDVRELSEFISVRRRRTRLMAVGRIIGFLIAASAPIALIKSDWRWLLFAPMGLAMGVLLQRVLPRLVSGDPGPLPPRGRGRLLPGRAPLPLLCWSLSIAGVIVGLIGVTLYTRSDVLPRTAEEALAFRAGQSVQEYENHWIDLIVYGFVLAGIANRIGRIAAQRDAATVMAEDQRSPIVLLRSFADDKLRLLAHRTARQTTLERLYFRRRDRFEELLAWSLQRYGPVVAVAEPGKLGRPIGAARTHIDDASWLSAVEALLRTSALIVVVVGRTAGLGAEVSRIRETGLLDRTRFVIPPVSGPEAADRWEKTIALLGVEASLSTTDMGSVLIRIGGKRVVVYRGESRDDFTYEAAIDMSFG